MKQSFVFHVYFRLSQIGLGKDARKSNFVENLLKCMDALRKFVDVLQTVFHMHSF